jgi:A/G-specific adenine glycosylase
MAATEEELMKLPGIGKYTARAVLCFAFNRQVAVVDTNIRKVIMIEFQISNFKFTISNFQ